MKKIELYDSTNIDKLRWPETEEGQYARKFLSPLVKEGVHHYFDNIKTTMNVLHIDNLVMPVTINDKEYENSYVCSFYSQYVSYGLEVLGEIKNKFVRVTLSSILRGIGKVLQVGEINKVVSVNNWLFSTNIHPTLSPEQIAEIRKFLKERFPSHAIVFRSINTFDQKDCHKSLKFNKFDLIASRQVYHTDTKKEEVFSTRIFKSDLKLLRETPYEVIKSKDIQQHEIPKLLSLYKALYVEKHSTINPQINSKFLQHLLDHNLFDFHALRKDGEIDGVVGHYSRFGVLSSPFFGYDTQKPQNLGLYRLLSTILALEAKNSKQLFHQSSGASFYKTVRRAQPSIEYIAVYNKHLPLVRRLPWFTLKLIMNYIGINFMKKY